MENYKLLDLKNFLKYDMIKWILQTSLSERFFDLSDKRNGKDGILLENLILSANIVLPLFVLMGLGYGAKCLHLIDEHTIEKMNNLSFRVFVPIMICENIMTADVDLKANPWIFAFAAGGLVLLFFVSWLIVPHLEKENRKKSVMIQGMCRGNYVLFGIPLARAICPGQDTAIASLLVVVVVPMVNVLSVIVLEVYRGGKMDFRKILKGILTNPLILSSLLGFLLLKLEVSLPQVIMKPVEDIAGLATPLALFVLGGSFAFSKIGKNLRQLSIMLMGKLIAAPAIFVTLAALLGFRGAELASLMVAFAAPAAVNSYTMAQQMGGDAELAAQHVVFSSAFSVITIFGMVFLGKQLALF